MTPSGVPSDLQAFRPSKNHSLRRQDRKCPHAATLMPWQAGRARCAVWQLLRRCPCLVLTTWQGSERRGGEAAGRRCDRYSTFSSNSSHQTFLFSHSRWRTLCLQCVQPELNWVIPKGCPQKYSKNRPHPLVRFCSPLLPPGDVCKRD